MKSAFSTQATPSVSVLMSTGTDKYNAPSAINKIANWQAALIQSDSMPIEFQIKGSKSAAIGDTNTSTPVLNGLQLIPVVEFLQPKVDVSDAPVNYYLPAGNYALMYVQGAVNNGMSQPRYSGGWYKLTHSTATTPTIMRLNYPEVNRYLNGTDASINYAGRMYTFAHASDGFISLVYEDIPGHYTDNAPKSLTTPLADQPYTGSGLAYTSSSPGEPIAPVFALINLDLLNNSNNPDDATNVRPPLFYPTAGDIPDTGLTVSMTSMTTGVNIYYTMTTATTGMEPDEPADPTITSTRYIGPFTVTMPTKIRAVAYKGTKYSYLRSVYYK